MCAKMCKFQCHVCSLEMKSNLSLAVNVIFSLFRVKFKLSRYYFKFTYAFMCYLFRSLFSRCSLLCLFNWSHLSAINIFASKKMQKQTEKRENMCHNRTCVERAFGIYCCCFCCCRCCCHHHLEPIYRPLLITVRLMTSFVINFVHIL